MLSSTRSRLLADEVLLPSTKWQNNFGLLWTGQTVSVIGSQFSNLVIQMVAVTSLQASPAQMGFLTASQTLPYLALSLFVGALIDRASKRSLLLIADGVRAVVLLGAAVILFLGQMTVLGLCCLVCLVSVFTLIFDAALGAAIPELFEPDRRISVNSRLNLSLAAGDVTGPTMSGYALHLSGVPGTMLLDCLSYVISAAFIWWGIPPTESKVKAADTTKPDAGLFRSIFDGIYFVWSQGDLRVLGIGSGIWNFSWSAVLAVLVIHCARDLRLTSTQIGFCFAAGGMGGILGSILGWRLGKSFPYGPVLVFTPLIGVCGGVALLLPSLAHPFFLVGLALFLYNLGESSFGVNMQTVRQMITPPRLMGRMDTAMRFCFKGMASMGAIAGGLIASRYGLHTTLFLGATGLIATVLVFVCSDLRRFPETPGASGHG